jgi:hypothetical protein
VINENHSQNHQFFWESFFKPKNEQIIFPTRTKLLQKQPITTQMKQKKPTLTTNQIPCITHTHTKEDQNLVLNKFNQVATQKQLANFW